MKDDAAARATMCLHIGRCGGGWQMFAGDRSVMCFFHSMYGMYGTFTDIYHKHQPNVGKYTMHGWK